MERELIVKLEKEIERLLDVLTTLEPGTKEYEEVTENINKLYIIVNKEEDLNMGHRKLEMEDLQNIRDTRVKDDALRDSKIWSGAKVGLEIAGIVAPLVFYGIWMNKGLKFEETGSLTSTTFKGLVGKFKPGK